MKIFPLISVEWPDIASSYVGGSENIYAHNKTNCKKLQNTLPIPSTDENGGADGADGYGGGVGSTFVIADGRP